MKNSKPFVVSAGFALLMFVPVPTIVRAAAAQDDQTVELPAFNVSGDGVSPYRAADSVSASRIRGDIMDSPGSISVLTPEFLEDLDPTRIYEATRYLAGVSEGRANSFSDRQIIRGFENTGRTIDNFVGIQNQNTDSLFIDRIEVVKGPSAILAPTGTPGGSINVVSKVPQYTQSDVLTALVGWSDAQRVDLDVTGPFSPGSAVAYRVMAAAQDGHLNREGGMDKRALLGGEISYRIGSRTTLLVRATYEDNRLYVPFPVYVDSSDLNGGYGTLGAGFKWNGSRNGQETWAHRGGLYETADTLLTSSFGDHVSVRFATKAQYDIQDDQFEVGQVPSLSTRYNPYTGQETPDYTWALNKTTGQYVSTLSPYYDPTNIVRQPSWPHDWLQDFAAQFDVAAKYRWGPVSSTTVAGTAFEHENIDMTTTVGTNLPSFNLFAPVYGALPTWTTRSLWQTFNDQTWEDYADETLGFVDDRLQFTAGAVRVSALDRSTNFLVNNGYARLDDAKDLLLFGVVAKPFQHVSVYASKSVNAVPTIANSAPLWQEGQQYEYGVKIAMFDERLSFTAAHFQISQTNVTVPNPAFNTDPTVPQTLISDVKDHGVEFELTGSLTKELSVIANATYLYERDSLGRPVRAISGQNLALFANYDFAHGLPRGLSAFGGVTYVGRRSGEAPSPNFTPLNVPTQPSFFLPPLTLVSIGAKYRWSPRLTNTLNIDNLTDQKYLIPTARANNTLGDPLNIRLETRYHF